MSIDGGLTALGGFLYQTVGAMGIAAGAYQNISGLQLENADIETLLGFAKESVIRYEDEDQDTSIRYMLHGEQRGYILVQFKYSAQHPPQAITLPELKKILARLRASEKKACAHGLQVTGYSLLTNRGLSGPAQEMVDARRTFHLPFHVATSIRDDYWSDLLGRFAKRYGCANEEIEKGIREGIGYVIKQAGEHGKPAVGKTINSPTI